MKSDGTLIAKVSNPAVSEETLWKIFSWKEAGKSETDVIDLLRKETVQHSWLLPYSKCQTCNQHALGKIVKFASGFSVDN